MAASPTATAPPAREPLRRDRRAQLVAGVCAGIGRRLGVDPLIVRVAFVAAAAAGGVGFVLYGLAWLLMPAEAATEEARALPVVGRLHGGRGTIEVALGVGLLTLAFLLTLRALGLWFSDAIVWPVVLVAGGGALLWRQSLAPAGAERRAGAAERRSRAEERRERAGRRSAAPGWASRSWSAAGIVFLQATGALSAARDVLLAVLVVVVGSALILAPWSLRLVRARSSAERAERIRSQERAEMAAHLHDSVLQTLALVQKRADDPREVAALARTPGARAARLAGRAARGGRRARLAAALEAAAGEVEDAPRRRRSRWSPSATASSTSAARRWWPPPARRWSTPPSSARARRSTSTPRPPTASCQVFVRDRGPGFDPAAVPADRRGVRESIVGRMDAPRRPRQRSTPAPAPAPRSSSRCRRRRDARVAIVDDHGLFRAGVRAELEGHVELVGEAATRRRGGRARRARRARRRAARRPHARRRRRRGDPTAPPTTCRPRASWRCRSPTPPRTSSPSSAPARAAT